MSTQIDTLLISSNARSVAVRLGNSTVTLLHVAAALLDAYPTAADLLGLTREAIASRLGELPRTFANPTPDAQVGALLPADGPRRVPLAELLTRLSEQLLGNGSDPIAASAPEPLQIPTSLATIAVIAQQQQNDIARPEVTETILAAVGSQRPQTVLVVAPDGTGKAALARLLARDLGAPNYRGPLANVPVVRVESRTVIAANRADTLREVFTLCHNRAVAFIEDIEVLLGLGSPGGAEFRTLVTLRGAINNPEQHLILTIDSAFRERLRAADSELFSELTELALEPMTPAHVAQIVSSTAHELEHFHRVSIPPEVRRVAVAPPASTDVLAQPALGILRLDRAAARASMRADRVVATRDAAPAGPAPEAETLDAAAAAARIRESIVGQDDAVDRVTRRLAITRNGLDLRSERPDGVFLFAGPTGTGKTALALEMARVLYGSADAIIRLDMSEFAEEHTVSKLIGSPPGYVGSDQPDSWLTTRIRRRPQSVLLLDEIEKSHPRVWNTFLQVFDAGRLSDGSGNVADFSQTTIVMTTNLGAEAFSNTEGPGFTAAERKASTDSTAVLRTITTTMAPELLNRLDDVIVFKPLSHQAIKAIAANTVAAAAAKVSNRGWILNIDPSVIDLVARLGYSYSYGARNLQRVVERLVLEPLVTHTPGRYRLEASEDTVVVVPEP
ncbi:MAG: AAA family ATPase [Actinomycetes bacterium]